VSRYAQERRVDISFATDAARVTVSIVAPGSPTAADAFVSTDRCAAGLAGRGARPTDVVVLARWVEARLREGGAQVTAPVDPIRAAAAGLDAVRLERGRAWLARLGERLDVTTLPPPWRLGPARLLDHGLGTIRAVEGAGCGFDVRLEVQGDPARPPVGADFDLQAGTDSESVRPTVEALLSALRG
jgi:hypothetical protein